MSLDSGLIVQLRSVRIRTFLSERLHSVVFAQGLLAKHSTIVLGVSSHPHVET